MRNDVKYIKKNIMVNNAANWSLVVDVFLVLLAFVLDRIYNENASISTLWVVIAICGVAIPLVLFTIEAIRIKRAEKISNRVLNTKELVSMFDDEICYMIMSAETFNKNLRNTQEFDSRQDALLLEFYVIEVAYYLNKAVHLILKMDNNLTGVLDENNSAKNHISKIRLINSISLIANIYEDLFNFAESQSQILKSHSVILDLSEAKEYYKSLKNFSERKKEIIGIDIETVFKQKLNK